MNASIICVEKTVTMSNFNNLLKLVKFVVMVGAVLTTWLTMIVYGNQTTVDFASFSEADSDEAFVCQT